MNTDITSNSHALNKVRKDALVNGNSHVCDTLANFEVQLQRELFDPANKQHLDHYRAFKTTGKWPGSMLFKLEWPYVSVPAAIEAKIINHALGI